MISFREEDNDSNDSSSSKESQDENQLGLFGNYSFENRHQRRRVVSTVKVRNKF